MDVSLCKNWLAFSVIRQCDADTEASGGYVNGKTLVLLLLVTRTITFPVGFSFYMHDPALTAWTENDKRFKTRKTTLKWKLF